jgi:small subunit ribosomal protein S18
MSYWNKEKKNSTFNSSKKRTNWNQSLLSLKPVKSDKKIKKPLQYLLLLKKFENVIDYKNIKLLKAFLNKYGKIRSRRKTRIPVQKQRAISKAIRKSRSFGLLPFTCDLKG